MKNRIWITLALAALFALVAAACSPGTDDALTGQADANGSTGSGSATDGDTSGGGSGADGDGTDPGATDDDTTGTDDTTSTDGGTDDTTDTDTDGSTDDTTGTDVPVDQLVWTVVGVEWDDTLNVRADPNASADIVTELDPWTTGLTMTGNVSGTTARWHEIALDGGATGWVNGRFVVGQPEALSADDEAALVARSEDFVAWVGDGDRGTPGGYITSRGVWTGGIGIYADAGSEWNWIPASDLASTAGWDTDRDFVVGRGVECGSECTLSTREFLNLDRIDGTSRILVNDIADGNEAHLEGKLWESPRSLHRVIIDTPTSDPNQSFDWQRLHLIPDWSAGDVSFKLIHNHGWTP